MNRFHRFLILLTGTGLIFHTFLFSVPFYMYPLTVSAFIFCYYAVVYQRPTARNIGTVPKRKIMFIVPCYNDYPQVVSTVTSIHRAMAAFPHPSFTIVVIDDGSTDGLVDEGKERLKGYCDFITKPKNSGSKAGAMQAVYKKIPDDVEFVVVLDSDTILDENAMWEAMHRFEEDPKLMAASGCIVPKRRLGFIGKLQYGEIMGNYGVMKRVQAQTGNVMVLAGAFSVHRKEAFKTVGYWENWIVEDICWTWRARIRGLKIGYLDKAIAYTSLPTGFGWLFRQRRRWARGRVEAAKVVYAEKGWKGLASVWQWLFTAFMEAFSPLALLICLYADTSMAIMYLSFFNIIAVIFAIEFKRVVSPVMADGAVHGRYKYEGGEVSNTFYALCFNFIIFPAVFLGFMDEILKRPKSWLTNEDKF